MNTKSVQVWYIAAALVAVLVLVAGWFLLVSPAKQNADDIMVQTDSVMSTNVNTQAKIALLKEQSKDLPAQQQQLAAIRNRIPETPELPTLIRTVSDQARLSGVQLDSLTPGQPAADGALSTIPVVLKVTGEFANVRLFVNGLEKMQRSYFVGGLDVQRVGDETSESLLETTITGNVFMSSGFDAPPATAATPAPAIAN